MTAIDPTPGEDLAREQSPSLQLVPELIVERSNLLDPGFELTLRPMRYPGFYDHFRDAIKNTWTVEEVDLHHDLTDLHRLSPASKSRGSKAGLKRLRATPSLSTRNLV